MIRLGGIFSGRTVAQDAATPPAPADAAPGTDGSDAFAARLRQTVDPGPATAAPLPPDDDLAAAVRPLGAMPLAATGDDDAGPPLPDPAVPPLPADMDLSRITLPVGDGGRRPGRVRTRLLGFDPMQGIDPDPIDAVRNAALETAAAGFPAGWIVVIRGPGRGTAFALANGVSQIGRGPDQAVRLDFGDISISRSNHAAIAYDDEANSFFIGHGGKANLVRLNDRPVVSTEVLQDRDIIRIGETALLFVALCRDDFRWHDEGADGTG